MQAQLLVEYRSPEAQPDVMAERGDIQALVRGYLTQLSAKYRVVLILRYLEERIYEEMAQILTLPIGTIKTHLFRARTLLKHHVLTHG